MLRLSGHAGGGTAALSHGSLVKGVGLARLRGRLFYAGTAVILLAVAGLPSLRDALLPPQLPAMLCKCHHRRVFLVL